MIEAASKRWEREHNGRVWLAWHIAALSRTKKMPNIKKMFITNTSRPRQHWREQLAIFTEYAEKKNAWFRYQQQERLANGG